MLLIEADAGAGVGARSGIDNDDGLGDSGSRFLRLKSLWKNWAAAISRCIYAWLLLGKVGMKVDLLITPLKTRLRLK